MGLRLSGRGRPLPEADINACVPTAWPGVLKNFRASAKKSGHGVNFRTTFKISRISGQRPGLRCYLRYSISTHSSLITGSAKHNRHASQPAIHSATFLTQAVNQNKSSRAVKQISRLKLNMQITGQISNINSIFHYSSLPMCPLQFPPKCNGIICRPITPMATNMNSIFQAILSKSCQDRIAGTYIYTKSSKNYLSHPTSGVMHVK